MTEATPDAASELAGIRRTLELHERWLGAMATGQHALAQQIGEIAISIRDMNRNFPAMMAQSMRVMITDPDVWSDVRKAMNAKAASTVYGGLIDALKWAWRGSVVIALAYAIGGMPSVWHYLKGHLG